MPCDAPGDQYFEAERSEIFCLLPPSIDWLLDVGCGAGRTARLIADRTGAGVWGVEPDEGSSARAEERLDHVVSSTVEESMDELPDRRFDLVMLTDVLEHLYDPGDVLRQLRAKIAPDGKLLVTVPNARHFRLIVALLMKADFPSEPSGLFDRTHIRWFTRRSLVRTLEASGFSVDKIIGINRTRSWKVMLLKLAVPFVANDCHFLQYATLCSVDASFVEDAD